MTMDSLKWNNFLPPFLPSCLLFFYVFKDFIYLRERGVGKSVRGRRGREREREGENFKQILAPSRAPHGVQFHDPEIMT